MEHFRTRLGDRLLRDASAARFTAARLGGQVDWLYIARDSLDELVEVVTSAWQAGLPVRVIGGGANVLVADSGFRGLLVVNHVEDIQTGDWHDGRNLSATSGTSLTHLARRAAALGLSGLEWAVGVPGTVGGAVVNNAGAHGACTADNVADVVVLEHAQGAQLYPAAALDYAYRTSALKQRADRRYLVLLATFCLTPDAPAAIEARMAEYNAYRKRTQPPGASLGSVFKNPPGDYAGRLIETAGLKGLRIGSAEVSTVHANFFLHHGGGSAADYHALVRHVQRVVREAHHIDLEPEIEFIGEFA